MCHALFEYLIVRHELVTSEFILNELQGHLRHKFRYSDAQVNETLAFLRSTMAVVETMALAAPVCRDPEDDMILATAVAGGADCVVTGDQDLLVLRRFGDIRILAPADFAGFEAEPSS